MKRIGITLLLLGFVFWPSTTRPADAPERIRIALGGDVTFGRVVGGAFRPHGHDALSKMAQKLREADLTFVNLESGVCEKSAREGGHIPLLLTRPADLNLLADAGVDIVSAANNHALDCGADGLSRTAKVARGAGINVVGLEDQKPALHESGVVTLAVTTHPVPYVGQPRPTFVRLEDMHRVVELIEAARARFPDELIMLSIHWGREWHVGPAAWQQDWARAFVDAGADLIVGHGSHVVEPSERYRGRLILYGLGNLIFDGPRSRDAAPTLVICERRDGRFECDRE